METKKVYFETNIPDIQKIIDSNNLALKGTFQFVNETESINGKQAPEYLSSIYKIIQEQINKHLAIEQSLQTTIENNKKTYEQQINALKLENEKYKNKFETFKSIFKDN